MSDKQNELMNNDIKTELSRDMGLFSVTMIGVGAMIGAGIFVLTGIAAGHAGPALILVFVLNAFVTLLTAFSYAELGSTFPEAGGGYLWVKDGLGDKQGFFAGWMSWFAHSVACSLYILGFGYYFWEGIRFIGIDTYLNALVTLIAPGYSLHIAIIYKVLAVLAVLLFGYINIKGASETGKWGNIITIIKIIILGIFIAAGLMVVIHNPHWGSKFKPFLPKGFTGVLGAMGLTFIAFEGYEIIVQSGEEVKNPARNLPRAIFISIAVVVPIYVLVGFVALGATEIPEAIRSAHPQIVTVWDYLSFAREGAIVEAARQFMPLGHLLMIIGGLFATMSALNATIYSSSRVSFAMGRDMNLPEIFSHIHKQKKTPHMAIFLSVMLIIIIAVSLPIKDVASGSDLMFIFLFIQVNLTLIVLRKKRYNMPRAFRVPLVPFLPIVAIILQLVLGVFLFNVSWIAWATVVVWMIIGFVVYYSFVRVKKVERVAAEVLYEEKAPVKTGYRILVPLAHPQHIQSLIQIASSIASDKNGEILVLSVVSVPAQLPVAEGKHYIENSKKLIRKAVKLAKSNDIPVHSLIKIGHKISTAITDTVRERDVDMMIMGWKGFSNTMDSVFGIITDDVVVNAECDVMMIKMVHLDKMKTIFMPTSGGPNMDFALDLVPAIADTYHSSITLSMMVPPLLGKEEKENRKKVIDDSTIRLRERVKNVEGSLIEAKSISKGILEEAEKYDICILGAAREGLVQQMLFGNIPEIVSKNSNHTVIMVKKYQSALQNILNRLFSRQRHRILKK